MDFMTFKAKTVKHFSKTSWLLNLKKITVLQEFYKFETEKKKKKTTKSIRFEGFYNFEIKKKYPLILWFSNEAESDWGDIPKEGGPWEQAFHEHNDTAEEPAPVCCSTVESYQKVLHWGKRGLENQVIIVTDLLHITDCGYV